MTVQIVQTGRQVNVWMRFCVSGHEMRGAVHAHETRVTLRWMQRVSMTCGGLKRCLTSARKVSTHAPPPPLLLPLPSGGAASIAVTPEQMR
jgi:hypothetical protein